MDVEPHKPTPNNNIVILPLDINYIDALIDLQRIGYRLKPEDYHHPEVMQADDFRSQIEFFPDGQFMALDITTDQVVGSCSSMIIEHDETQPLLKSWIKTTARGSLRTHNPNGNWLYGVDNVVLPSYRGQRIGGRMMEARFKLTRKYNLKGMIAGSMPIDYHKAAAVGVSIEQYVADVIAGTRWDTNLSKQIKKGFKVGNIIPDYLMDAPSTRNYAVTIYKNNPEYRPLPKPTTRRTARPNVQPRSLR